MARTATEKLINGKKYTINQLPATESLDLLMDLVKMLGPGLAPLFDNIGTLTKALDRDVDQLESKFLSEAVKTLCAGLDKSVTHRCIQKLASVTVIEGAGQLSACFDVYYSGNLGELFQWLPAALKGQYADFFGVLQNAIRSLPSQQAKDLSASQS